MATSLLAVYMLGKKIRNGFLVFVLSNILWVVMGVLTDSWAMIAGNLIFLALNLQGYWRWGQEDASASSAADTSG